MDFKLTTMTILLVPAVLCLGMITRFACCAVIKRTGSELSNNDGNADSTINRVSIKREKCKTIPETVLSAVLGPAFNARYMSIDDPRDDSIETDSSTSGITKRKTSKVPSFFVEEEFNSVFSNDPAWDFQFSNMRYKDHMEENQENTSKRDTVRDIRHVKNTPWQCEAKVEWIDLGHDYFPRFLRTVKCTKSNCWYGFYTCKPRSFTVKLLRRRTGICIPTPSIGQISATSYNIGDSGLPNELKELWIWEERAVNFCCECAAGS